MAASYASTSAPAQTAAVIAQIDADERKERQIRLAILKEEQALLDGLDAELKAFIDLTDLAVQLVLTEAGFHQHHRGEWRKQRGRQTRTDAGRQNGERRET